MLLVLQSLAINPVFSFTTNSGKRLASLSTGQADPSLVQEQVHWRKFCTHKTTHASLQVIYANLNDRIFKRNHSRDCRVPTLYCGLASGFNFKENTGLRKLKSLKNKRTICKSQKYKDNVVTAIKMYHRV